MALLEVCDLCKEYPGFQLDKVSFSLEAGEIMGFIGRNGAGKTTTIKSILRLVHPDGGSVRCFGLDMAENERDIRQRLGYAGGTVSYYRKKKISDIVTVTRSFYPNWEDDTFGKYASLFHLDENKTPEQFSEGMKVKLNLAMALSHRAELLILDEPTSGLDPVSRDELLEIFLRLAREGIAVLFSTHITSDLEKCAHSITYIRQGRMCRSSSLDSFRDAYRLAEHTSPLEGERKNAVLGECLSRDGISSLIAAESLPLFPEAREATLEEIMIHLEKEGHNR